MKVLLLRHGMTKGNREHRYVGSTDEGVLAEFRDSLIKRAEELRKNGLIWKQEPLGEQTEPECIYVSPMLRCRETTEILFPHSRQIVIPKLRECDFGEFEYLNYQELNGNIDFQRFIDTNGQAGFPGGEDLSTFQQRCLEGFREAVQRHQKKENREPLVLVVHGGTIMSILDRYSVPHKSYYDWQVKNGEGFLAETDGDAGWDDLLFRNIRKV